jgi:hypothetical protein
MSGRLILMNTFNRGKTKDYVTWDIVLRTKDGSEFIAQFAEDHKEYAIVALNALRAHRARKARD